MKWSTLFLVFLMVSCGFNSSKKPKDILSEEILIPLMVDVHLADAMANNEKVVDIKTLNQVKKAYLEDVLKKHDVSISIYEKSLLYYREDPEIFYDIYDKIMIQLSSDEALLNGDKEEEKK